MDPPVPTSPVLLFADTQGLGIQTQVFMLVQPSALPAETSLWLAKKGFVLAHGSREQSIVLGRHHRGSVRQLLTLPLQSES